MQRTRTQFYNRAGEPGHWTEETRPGPYHTIEITTSAKGEPRLRIELSGEDADALMMQCLHMYVAGIEQLERYRHPPEESTGQTGKATE